MRTFRNPIHFVHREETSSPNKRRHGRLRVECLECKLGKVEDISRSGVRVSGRGRCPLNPGDELHVDLWYEIHRLNHVKSRVVWTRQTSFFAFQIGLEFENLSDEYQARITQLASLASVQRLMPS